MAKSYDVEIEIVGVFASLPPHSTILKFGGAFPWEEREGEGTFCCPDHKNITVCRLRRIERAR